MTISQTYQLQPGDTLSKVAATYCLTLPELLAANPHINNPNEVTVGEAITIPASTAGKYDGLHPAPGTTTPNQSALIFPPVTSTVANRSQALYDQVIDQLAVGNNPRYLPANGCTYCNIFVWDVTRAMNCAIPHWVLADGTIAAPGQPGAFEIDIDEGAHWMTTYGVPRYGWQLVDAATAQAHANAGQPAVAIWSNPGGHGHTAVVRAGVLTARGPAIAQAGGHNFNYGHLADGFGELQPLFYAHT
jgi:LysM repeat protein